ncbi:sugar transferase [Roseiflexus sp.]|uniref:sugar transferase n=1 Tax=Roseiflexus sp. TaxID=2562120 RepID=UPI00398BB8B9
MSRRVAFNPASRSQEMPFHLRLEISERRLLLRLGDLVLTAVAVLGSLWIWARLAGRSLDIALIREQIAWVALIGMGWPLWLMLADMYNLRLVARVGPSLRRIFLGGLVLLFGYLLFFFVQSRALVTGMLSTIETGSPPLRFAPMLAIAGLIMLMSVWRLMYIRVLGAPHARRRLLILGTGQAGSALSHVILKGHSPYYEIVGFVDDSSEARREQIGSIPVLGGIARLGDVVWEQRVDEIVIASGEVSGEVLQLLMDCYEQGVAITPMPLLYERLTGKIAVEHVGSQWYVALPLQSRPTRTAEALLKRLLDVAGSLALMALLAFLLPFIALAIRLDSPGPVFHRQRRVGWRGKPFTVLKFRSMIHDAEPDGEAQWAAKDDPRVTRVGRLLRRTRLDELPQALNVLRGEMSLVGPRPERPEFVEQLQQVIPFYRVRLAVRPGLTGWAQINHDYADSVDAALTKLQYDLYYLKYQSFWFDMLILARTVHVVLRMKGR